MRRYSTNSLDSIRAVAANYGRTHFPPPGPMKSSAFRATTFPQGVAVHPQKEALFPLPRQESVTASATERRESVVRRCGGGDTQPQPHRAKRE